ncbi:MAG: hypothetical protein HC847_07630 [Hydrococcus sp. RU_2_2]|nr:hypothetical protein [Hydrococcus sp. RU_2_2]
MKVFCPLSGSNNNVLIDRVKISDLLKIYNKLLKSDIASEFGNTQELTFYHCLDSDLFFFIQ